MNNKVRGFLERSFFGVCERFGKKMGVKTSKIRLFFIYVSFLTFGSPVVVYVLSAFLLELKDLLLNPKSTVWDLE